MTDGGAALTIRPLRAEDDLDAELDLRHRSFGPMRASDREERLADLDPFVANSRLQGAWDGTVLVGSAMFHDMRQWWGGRVVPMAGVGGVKVAPEARGRGVGKALMTDLLGTLARRGYPLSALYPATAHLYRSLGWELAGGHYRAEVRGRSLGSLIPPDPEVPGDAGLDGGRPAVRRATPDDAGAVIEVLGAVHAGARDCGPCTWDQASVRRWLAEPDFFGYLAPDGFLRYGWHGRGSREIMIHSLQAASARTARALWGIVASHATVTEVVHANVRPDDPICWLTSEQDVNVRLDWRWMLRVIDPRAAIEGRGFPAGVSISVPIVLADPDLPANAGLYLLEIGDGRGYLAPGLTERTAESPAPAPVRLGPRGFAALYAGTPMATLRQAGLVAGGDAQADAELDAAFAGRAFMLDLF